VRLLQEEVPWPDYTRYPGSCATIAELCTEDGDLERSTRSEDSQLILEQRIATLQAELAQARSDAGRLQHEFKISQDELQVTSTDAREAREQLREVEQQCTQQKAKLLQSRQDLNATKIQLQRLSEAKDVDWLETWTNEWTKTRPKVIQFQETKLKDESFETQIDFVQRFRIEPMLKANRSEKQHRRSTIACMEFEGVPYFAKNGEHRDTADGFIQGTY
jgi:chromosome segregation ATPase